jgi:hypothetical protein
LDSKTTAQKFRTNQKGSDRNIVGSSRKISYEMAIEIAAEKYEKYREI